MLQSPPTQESSPLPGGGQSPVSVLNCGECLVGSCGVICWNHYQWCLGLGKGCFRPQP